MAGNNWNGESTPPNIRTETNCDDHGGRHLCPSAPADENAFLLGVVQPNGKIAYLKDQIPVTQEFLQLTAATSAPETKFRFSSTCLSGACKQWSNGKCSLPERIAALAAETNATDCDMPACSIRDRCRWYAQQGASACHICPIVVTRNPAQ